MAQVIRTDKWELNPSLEDLAALRDTTEKYRDYVQYLIIIVNTHWIEVSEAEDQLQCVERLINKTKDNPAPKYGKFFGAGSKFYKFPSYLRRAAIHDAIGHVSSFHSRYRDWQAGIRKHREARPPRLTANCGVYPDLYKKQCIEFNADFTAAKIKVFKDNDWKWISVPIKSRRERHLATNSKMLSPTLVVKGFKAHLSVPFKVSVLWQKPTEKVCGVDLGINTTATCSIVDQDGKVHATKFIHDGAAIDKRDKHLARIRRKASNTMGKGGKLHKGFGKVHYRKARHINKHQINITARQIFNFAVENGAKTIVLEDLKGWKPKGGRKRSTLKTRFHFWLKSGIANRLEELAAEHGIPVVYVYARGTSSLAYDGSGDVKRDKKNHALALFQSGKRYNCDLSASYNIAARWIAYKLKLARKNGELLTGKSTGSKPRSQVTLSTLWADWETPTTAPSA